MRRIIHNFRRDQAGSILPLAVFLLAIAAGFAALSVDVGLMYSKKAELQRTADSAVLAAVVELPNMSQALAKALEFAEKNMSVEDDGHVLAVADVELGTWDAQSKIFIAGTSPASAIRVTTRRSQANGNPVDWHLAKILGMTTADISASAIAGMSAMPCLLALDPTAEKAIELDSNAEIRATNCEVYANSSNGAAISALSNSQLTSKKTCAVGGFAGSAGHYSPTPDTGCPTVSDPLSNIAPPPVGGCNYHDLELDLPYRTLTPGVYCGGILIKNNTNVTFEPGIYVIKDGEFKVDSNAQVQGVGTGFYLTGDSRIYFDSNTSVDFTAPTSGPMAGFIFFEDRNAPLLQNHEFNSNNIGTLEGAIYLSRGRLYIDSNTTIAAASAFTSVIVNQLMVNSNAKLVINTNYSASAVPKLGVGGSVDLLL